MMLAIAGKFPGDYEDGRFSGESMPAAEHLTANLGRMPVATVGGKRFKEAPHPRLHSRPPLSRHYPISF